MKKIVAVAGLVLLYAALALAQAPATDYGSKQVINHSNGVVTFDYGKLNLSKNLCPTDGGTTCINQYNNTVKYYTTIAAYPTAFIPETIVFDGGCQRYTLTEQPTFTTGRVANKAIFCHIEVPFTELDAGTVKIYRHFDGGYGLNQCPAERAITSAAWPAFCMVQNGLQPTAP